MRNISVFNIHELKFSIYFYDRAEENFPLREAVEKIPPLNNLLEDFKSQRIYKQQETKGNKMRTYSTS